MAEPLDLAVVHLATGPQTACGIRARNVATTLTLRPEQVTCPGCRRTITGTAEDIEARLGIPAPKPVDQFACQPDAQTPARGWQDAAEGIAGPDGLKAREAVEPLDLVDADGDRIRFAITNARTTEPVEIAINGGDPDRQLPAEHLDVIAALTLDQLREIVAWGAHALGISTSVLAPALGQPHTADRTFTFRPAGEHHDVTVALHSLADCAICERNIPAGAFVVVHPNDDGPDRWAHETCAHPDQPARAPLNADQLAPAPHCPRCASPEPRLHPAVQAEGEVQPCPNPWHDRADQHAARS